MEFNIPEPFEVTHWVAPVIGENPAGQLVYGEAVPTTRRVRGFDQARAEEMQAATAAGRKITELSMADDEGDWPSDSVVEMPDGSRFEVNGDVRNENLGPFGFQPGFVIPLRRVTNGPS